MPAEMSGGVKPLPVLAVSAAASEETAAEIPAAYQTACDWVWQNRIEPEKTMKDRSTVFDQIIAGNGTLQYLLIWQSYEQISPEQRKKLPEMLEKAVNQWTDCLIGYDDWPFDHVKFRIVGYAVLDESSLPDLQPDETVFQDTVRSTLRESLIGSMGDKSIPLLQPAEPADYSFYLHWADKNWTYGGSYENRYDMFLHGVKGMTNEGGIGYHYGQILSDQSVLGLIDGTVSTHILLHEMGHGFGLPDYYGGEGETDGYPPNGFPGDGTSIMMAGASTEISSFDRWFLRYAWSRLKSEDDRFKQESITDSVQCDVNADGAFTEEDVMLLQKWLLGMPDTQLADWETGDLCADGVLNGADLSCMKQKLMNRKKGSGG